MTQNLPSADYNHPDWRARSKALLYPKGRKRPYCRMCRKQPATIVDHLIPHRGDRIIFWTGDLQLLCKTCHDSHKQSIEKLNKPKIGLDGFPIKGSKPNWIDWDELHEPADLKPSAPALTMIFGPPGAGKSTYVKKHAGKRDIIIDADLEASRIGIDAWTVIPAERARILSARNDAYRALVKSTAKKAWSTALGAKANVRRHWIKGLKPKQIIILLPDPQICIYRIRAASDRPDKATQISAVVKWFKEYQPRGGEKVIKI